MAAEAGLLLALRHPLAGVVAARTAPGRIRIDAARRAGVCVGGVVYLDALPAMIVVVLVEDEPAALPGRGEELIEALVVGHVGDGIDAPPLVGREAPIELGQARQAGHRMLELTVGHPRSAEGAQREVEV